MKHIKRFIESANSDVVIMSDEDIKEFFYDWTDDEKATISIKEANIINNELNSPSPYIKDPKSAIKAKIVTIHINERPKGVKTLDCNTHTINSPTLLDTLQNIISDIKRFYSITKEEMNIDIVSSSYDGISIRFVVKGPTINESDSMAKEIDELTKEFREIVRNNIKCRGIEERDNWTKINFTTRDDFSNDLCSIIRKIFNDTLYITDKSPSYQLELIKWKDKVIKNGLTIKVSAIDRQLIMSLKKS